MNCEICERKWDSKKHIPLLLPCGHSFCEECLKRRIINNKNTKCYTCSKNHPNISTEASIKRLTKNKALIEMTEKMGKSNSLITQSMIVNNLDQKMNINLMESADLHKLNNFYYNLCDSHKNRAYYYINSPKKYYCPICIEAYKIVDYNILPELHIQNEIQIESTLKKINILRTEIERAEKFITTYVSNFEIQNSKKIDELFDYIEKVIQYNYTTVKTLLFQCKNEQKNQADKKLEELKNLKNDLLNYETKINEYKAKLQNNNLSVKEQISNNSIFNKVGGFLNYDNEITLFNMKIDLKDDIKESLFDLIQNSFDIEVDFYKSKNEELFTLKKVLQKDNNWQCECGYFENTKEDIFCRQCQRNRQLETFDNLIFNPLKVSKEELNFLNNRRKHEIKLFQNDLNTNNKGKYYIIDTNWFLQWKCFVTNDLSDKYISNSNKKISENKIIGVLPPLYINNSNICELNNKTGNIKKYVLKTGLKYKEHFIIVNEPIWNHFILNYKGGPEIIVDERIKNKLEKGLTISDDSDCNYNSNSDVFESQQNFDPNNTYLNETVNKIQPISMYKFETRLAEFRNEHPEDDEKAFKRFNSMFENLIIKDNTNI